MVAKMTGKLVEKHEVERDLDISDDTMRRLRAFHLHVLATTDEQGRPLKNVTPKRPRTLTGKTVTPQEMRARVRRAGAAR